LTDHATPGLGLRENLGQFSLLVIINAFVGAMVGVERIVVPVLGECEFGLASSLAILMRETRRPTHLASNPQEAP
jgi:hypothetical protein